jgi:choline dehydrogenase-like flavoprotein
VRCDRFDGFPCLTDGKADAHVRCVRPALEHPNVTLRRHAKVERLETNASGRSVTSVVVDRKGIEERYSADVVVVSCGAVNSAALLLRSASDAHPDGLANSSGLVGRRYMAHLATMMEAIDPFAPNDTNFSKTVAINDYYLRGPRGNYPLGQIQSQGRTHGLMAKLHAPWWGRRIPLALYDWWVGRGFDWLVMSEDLPHLENRVTIDSQGRLALHYRQSNVRAHRELVDETKRILSRLGLRFPVTHSHGARNTTHQCGTVVFGTDPRESVLDPFCRAHDVANLFVVDASFFPSSAAVNPGLTIIAQALRAADHILATELGQRSELRESPVFQS